MNKVVRSVWQSAGVAIFLLAAPTWSGAEAPRFVNPDQGFALDKIPTENIAPAKLEKLRSSLKHGAEKFQAGDFEQSVKWYESAATLEPNNKSITEALETARLMAESQKKLQAEIPAAQRERQRFLENAYSEAMANYKKERYDLAQQSFQKLWMTAGDFKGQTLKMYRKAAESQRMASAKAAEARAAQLPVVAAPADQPAEEVVIAPAVEIAPGAGVVATSRQDPPALITPSTEAIKPVVREDIAENAAVTARAQAAQAETTAQTREWMDRDLNSANTMIERGDYKQAREMLTVLLAQEPNFEPARVELQRIDTLEKVALETTQARERDRMVAEEAAKNAASRDAAEQLTRAAEDMNAAGAQTRDALLSNLPADQAAATQPDDVTILSANRILREAEKLADEGKREAALEELQRSIDMFPNNPRAIELKQRLEVTDPAKAPLPQVTPAAGDAVPPVDSGTANPTKHEPVADAPVIATGDRLALDREMDEMHFLARQRYDAGDLAGAREVWTKMLARDPGNKVATTWLTETEAAYQRHLADQSTRDEAQARRTQAETLLSAPITISTDRKIPLSEFLYSLSFTTPSDLEYNIVEGADAEIFANFVDQSLREVLDTVLIPIGLTWSINERNVITIEPNMIARTWTVSQDQMAQVRSLKDSGNLQNIVWGQTEAPAKGAEIILDERQNIVLLRGSKQHIDKMEAWLKTLSSGGNAPALQTRFYKIREEDGPKIRALINSLISPTEDTPFELERKVIVEGNDLFIRDSAENLKRIEDLLMDKEFIEKSRAGELDLRNFSLVPKEVENAKSDQIQVFTSRVVEAIKVFLYRQGGERAAAEEGRRLWFDEATLQLTVVDTPANLNRISDYIDSLPEIRQRSLQKIIFLRYAVAEDMASSLERILDLTTSGYSSGGGGGTEVVFKLRRGEERTFRDIRVRATGFDDGDEDDRQDDTMRVSVSTATSSNQSLQLTELIPQTVDDYELLAENVVPNSSLPNEGSGSIRIRYFPQEFGTFGGGGFGPSFGGTPGSSQFGTGAATPGEGSGSTGSGSSSVLEDLGITISPFGELNALILRYTNPALYEDARELIDQLDRPTKQVEIETKFVQVNETRAKEFSADFGIAGLGSGRDIDWSNQLVNSRFAQDSEEYRSVFEPSIENPINSSLLKGTTVLNAVIGGFPQIQYSLRLLEAEGILNIVNGPKVTTLDGQEAQFSIQAFTGSSSTSGAGGEGGNNNNNNNNNNGGSNGGNNNRDENAIATIQEPLQNSVAFSEGDVGGTTVQGVILRVTPQITSADSIILNDLYAELIDLEGEIASQLITGFGELTSDQNDNNNDNEQQSANTVDVPDGLNQAQVNTGSLLLRRKKINTFARTRNGGTIVIGGWSGERTQELTSGVPVLRNMPYVGKLLFSRAQRTRDRTTLLIFLTTYLIDSDDDPRTEPSTPR